MCGQILHLMTTVFLLQANLIMEEEVEMNFVSTSDLKMQLNQLGMIASAIPKNLIFVKKVGLKI